MSNYLQDRSNDEKDAQVDVLAEITICKSGEQPAAKSGAVSKPN